MPWWLLLLPMALFLRRAAKECFVLVHFLKSGGECLHGHICADMSSLVHLIKLPCSIAEELHCWGVLICHPGESRAPLDTVLGKNSQAEPQLMSLSTIFLSPDVSLETALCGCMRNSFEYVLGFAFPYVNYFYFSLEYKLRAKCGGSYHMWETEAGELLWIWCQPGVQSEGKKGKGKKYSLPSLSFHLTRIF